ncbi:ABC transporter permease [Clostridium sp. CCUG 7971]|uniref:ABC transporter permease n=1 Tax=Clostridium sp. CCUG 7971 TaxID=2811414 RepID=UPI001ABB2348|nr:ABC transporter permease [Clostridium sp. CCUG 7971]MBO3443467.1 ABC transporter permease [Clostridium sp. CCUG 7971]
MNIIISTIKRSLRDKSIILTTIFLVLILPYIFSMMFGSESKVETVNINIIADEKSSLTKSYIEFIDNFEKNNKAIKIVHSLNSDSESEDLGIKIDEKNKSVKILGSKKLRVSESIVQNITEEFFNQITINEIANKNKEVNESIIKETVLKSESNPNENRDYKAYFAVIMLQMATLTASIYAFKNVFYIKENIGERVLSSPIKISKLLIMEVIGSFIAIFTQGVITLLMISIIYGVKITTINIFGLLYLMALLSLLAVSIGIFVSAIAKKRIQGDNIVSWIVTVLALSSGKFIPNMFDNNVSKILKLNPFTLLSESMLKLVDSNIYSNIGSATILTMFFVVVLVAIARFILKRKVVK